MKQDESVNSDDILVPILGPHPHIRWQVMGMEERKFEHSVIKYWLKKEGDNVKKMNL